MRSLDLNFPDGGQEARSAGFIVLLLGIAVLTGVLYQFKAAMEEGAYWDLRIAGMDRRMQKTLPQGAPTPGGREIKQEIKRANAVLSEIDLPWEALFDSVEYANRSRRGSAVIPAGCLRPHDADWRRGEKYAGAARFCRRPGA